jgi:putative hydrolase of the HAD superfamily
MDVPIAVSFDFGQTLADLDPVMLARRAAEQRCELRAERLEAALPDAWRAYDLAIAAGQGGHPWKLLMTRLLEGGGLAEERRQALVDWLWTEQPKNNLWRRPVPGMIELVRELRCAAVPVAVLSNSEGHLAELIDELGLADLFDAVADSGKLGIEKPDPAIFAWTAARLGVASPQVVHVGDSLQADVLGALRAGMRAVWFTTRGEARAQLPEGAARCGDAGELRATLRGWGMPLPPD